MLPKNIHSALIHFTLMRCSRSFMTLSNLLISLGTEANVSMLKLLVIVSASSPVVLESWIFDLISYDVFRLKNKYWNIPNTRINIRNTIPIIRSFCPTTIIINGRNIISLTILKTKLSSTFSYDHANLFIFFTSEPEKLLVKNLYECLWIYAKHCWNILLITLGSKLTIPNPTILHHVIEIISIIAMIHNIQSKTGTNVGLLDVLVWTISMIFV